MKKVSTHSKSYVLVFIFLSSVVQNLRVQAETQWRMKGVAASLAAVGSLSLVYAVAALTKDGAQAGMVGGALGGACAVNLGTNEGFPGACLGLFVGGGAGYFLGSFVGRKAEKLTSSKEVGGTLGGVMGIAAGAAAGLLVAYVCEQLGVGNYSRRLYPA